MSPTPGLPLLEPATRAACQQVAERLALDAVEVATCMTNAVVGEIPEYAPFASEPARQVVFDHSLDHVHAVVNAIRTWTLPNKHELAFVRERGALRATQQLPLSALLQSYRLGHRTVWEHLIRLLNGSEHILEASLALTALTLAYTESISAALADGYTERQRQLLVQVDRDRRDLLERILLGTFDRHSDTARLASTFALVPGGDYLVIVLTSGAPPQPTPTGEVLSRAADTLKRHLGLGVAQPFVVVRQAEIISVAPLARARATSLAHLTRQSIAELYQRGGEQWRAGISTICSGLGEVARGYEEARLATDCASDGTHLCALLEMRVSDYLLHRADETATRMIPLPARQLLESAHADDRLLVETLCAFASAELSVTAAAEALDVHPNTVSYRLRKLGQRLGRDLGRFSELEEVLAWVRLLRHC